MQVFLKNLEGKTLTLSLEPTDSIENLKSLITDRCSIAEEDQLVTFGGKLLQEGTLGEYGVEGESTLHLSLRLPGSFGAGNIPSFSFLEGKAYRHGDIEDSLAEMLKKSSGMFGGLSRGSKFGGLDIKRVYFGNWLRDYSQAMDCAALSKLPKQTILNLCMGLGFLAHGYATGEFEVTDERLGVYLCTEHIDNPKGYAADQPGGDARHLDPRLRPPVDPQELEIDPRTGMKNYIANENGTWDTSSRLLRERITNCIVTGRRARNSGDERDLYECYRLLGTVLHTLEDFSAHSNWTELSLKRLGYSQVFCHVGEKCLVQTPAGPAPPLVTGTFGGADFIHSLLGEATDHISEASVSDLAKAMDGAKSRSMDGSNSATDTLRDMLFQLPGSTGQNLSREMNDVEGIRSRANAGVAANMSPQELHAQLWKVLTFRDNVVKGIENTIEKIPGLSSIVEKLTDSINRFVFTTLEPLLKPLMGQATTALQTGSTQVLNDQSQFEVFDNPHSSDPTHSFLSKDHFAVILNEPAGMLAVVILKHTVKLIVDAWEHDNIDINQTVGKILEAFHHPYFYNDNSQIQREMGETLKRWIDSQPASDKAYILKGLTKDAIRKHQNKRKGHESDNIGHGCGGEYNSFLSPEKVSSFASQHVPGASGAINTFHQAQNTWNSAQNYIGGGNNQHGRRDMDGNFVPEPAGPPPALGGYDVNYSGAGGHPGPSYDAPPPMGYQHPGQGGYDQGPPAGFHPGYGGGGGYPEPQGPPPNWGGPPPPPSQQGGYYNQQQQQQPPWQGGNGGYPGSGY